MDRSRIIRCYKIGYRQGFIEVQPEIHDGCINIETWQIDPGIEISNTYLGDDTLPDNGITSNTEIELSLKNAEKLADLLQNAIGKIKSRSNT